MQVRETPPFAPVLMESTRAIGYSLEGAIADIIDNSIAAKSWQSSAVLFPVDDPVTGRCLHLLIRYINDRFVYSPIWTGGTDYRRYASVCFRAVEKC